MNKKRFTNSFNLTIIILILVAVNLISSRYFKRLDLTKENRFSVSQVTKDMFREMKSPILISVYLEGEMPTRYNILHNEIETYLNELRIYSNDQMDFVFVDPTGNESMLDDFYQKGYAPFQVTEYISSTEQKDMYILPYAVVNYQKKDIILNLIQGCVYRTQSGALDIEIDKAIQNFEYTLVSNLYNLVRQKTKSIGFLGGHGEYSGAEVTELKREIETYYSIIDVDVSNGEPISPSVDVLVVNKPDSTFSERELYEIDQYLMRAKMEIGPDGDSTWVGGKVLWILDQERINWDIGSQQNTLTQLRDLNLDYMFMKWGVKINYDIVQDMYCDLIDVAVDNPTYGTQMKKTPWVFHPLVDRFPDHPVTKNLDRVSIRFGSSIDTTHIPGINKEVILRSSDRARTIQGTQFIDIDQYTSKPIPPNLFDQGAQTMGIVLSGKFESLYRKRDAPVDDKATQPPTAIKIPNNVDLDVPKMAFISDGEFASGALYRGKVHNMPYDNKAFVLNLIDYLSGDDVISKVRSKEVILRTLDREKVVGNRSMWQMLNIVLPVMLILLFGFVRFYLRKRKNLAFRVMDPNS